jgi:hypothetical protein
MVTLQSKVTRSQSGGGGRAGAPVGPASTLESDCRPRSAAVVSWEKMRGEEKREKGWVTGMRACEQKWCSSFRFTL